MPKWVIKMSWICGQYLSQHSILYFKWFRLVDSIDYILHNEYYKIKNIFFVFRYCFKINDVLISIPISLIPAKPQLSTYTQNAQDNPH